MFIELLILLITFLLIYDYLIKKRRYDVLSYMPGPRPLPIVGNIFTYIGRSPEGIFNIVSKNRQKYGPMYRLWLFNRVAVFLTDPNDIEVILSSPKHIRKNTFYDILIDWLGTGLLLSTGQKWQARRKATTPAFHFKILEQFVEVFDQQSNELISIIKDKADGKTSFDIYPYVCRMALDIIAETAMGTKINAQNSADFGFAQATHDITAIFNQRLFKIWYRLNILFRLFSPSLYKKQIETIKIMHDFTKNVIKERRIILEKLVADGSIDPSNDIIDEIGRKRKMALLDVLLLSKIDGNPLSNEDIREEVDTFMFGGHDTSTTATSFTLYLLSRHPEIQKKVYEEIRQVIGDDKKKSITMHNLIDLKYLECVIKECLRLYPPVPFVGRKISEDVDINGKMIPAGCDVTVGICVLLRDPKYFPKPNDFIPERHAVDNISKNSHAYAFIPFSAGPRNCVGQKFALLEIKSTISKILRNYEVLPLGPEIIPMMNITTRSVNGVQIGLKERL